MKYNITIHEKELAYIESALDRMAHESESLEDWHNITDLLCDIRTKCSSQRIDELIKLCSKN